MSLVQKRCHWGYSYYRTLGNPTLEVNPIVAKMGIKSSMASLQIHLLRGCTIDMPCTEMPSVHIVSPRNTLFNLVLKTLCYFPVQFNELDFGFLARIIHFCITSDIRYTHPVHCCWQLDAAVDCKSEIHCRHLERDTFRQWRHLVPAVNVISFVNIHVVFL